MTVAGPGRVERVGNAAVAHLRHNQFETRSLEWLYVRLVQCHYGSSLVGRRTRRVMSRVSSRNGEFRRLKRELNDRNESFSYNVQPGQTSFAVTVYGEC